MSELAGFAGTDDVSHAIRRMRWVSASFRAHLDAQAGMRFDLDQRRLGEAFVEWLREFDARRPQAARRRRDFARFAAGLMLASLVRHDPARFAEFTGDAPGEDDPRAIWPEGYACLGWCLEMRAAVMREEFGEAPPAAPEIDPRAFASFSENMRDDPALAIPFLDHFAGDAPDWAYPAIASTPGEARLSPASRSSAS